MRILLTGGAGFIGARIAKTLAAADIELVIADDLTSQQMLSNLPKKRIVDWLSKSDLLALQHDSEYFNQFDAIVHQGAITSTTYPNFEDVYRNNFVLSKKLAQAAKLNAISFIYASSASVYGRAGQKSTEISIPLNYYAFSKYLFDEWIQNYDESPTYLGLRYFNVYGPGEEAKGDMASMVFHSINQIAVNKKVKLFANSVGCADGEHKRDFVFVDDIADIVKWALNNPWKSKIVDVGTGVADTFNNLVRYTFESLGVAAQIEYVPMPEKLISQYQSFTEAYPNDLREIGYFQILTPLREGIEKYITEIKSNNG